MRILTVGLILLPFLAPPAVLATPDSDHLKCYRIKDPLKLKGIVDIHSQQLGLEPGCKIKKAVLFCVPASKNVRAARNGKEAISLLPIEGQALADDRICYRIECKRPFPPDQEVTDQFGSRVVRRLAPFLLCGPAIKGVPPATTTTTTLPHACPTRLRFESNSDRSDFDRGWSGLAHDQHFPSGLLITLSVSCDKSHAPCGQCDVNGIAPDPSAVNLRRCNGDTSVPCTGESDCASYGGSCEHALGHPLPVSTGGIPVCLQGYVDSAVSGTVNLDEGSASLRLPSAKWEIFLGIRTSQPCPICEGDLTTADGVKNGTCSGGENNGSDCDAGATAFNEQFGPTSLDCPPLLDLKIGTITTGVFTFTTNTQVVTLSAQSPDCGSPFSDLKCFCGSCSTSAAEPCFTNDDCPLGSTCGGKRCLGGEDDGAPCTLNRDCESNQCGRAGEPTKPNSCFNPGSDCLFSVADTDSVDEGWCESGPLDDYCSIETYRGCVTDEDCNPPPTGVCPDCIEGQTCLSRARECYTDNGAIGGEVRAAGASAVPLGGTWSPTLGALFCITPTDSSTANTVLGLPGLGRITLPLTVTNLP